VRDFVGPSRRFRGIGTPGASTGAGIPANMGGNAVQGQGIFFNYATATLASLAASATSGSINIQFDANSVFVWLRSSFYASFTSAGGGANITNSAVPTPNINVTIVDTGKGASFMNTPIVVWHIASTSPGLPYVLPVPQLIQANATFAWTFTNFDTSQGYFNLSFVLHGFRIFNPNIQSLGDALDLMGM
jgi:hypothetical protein